MALTLRRQTTRTSWLPDLVLDPPSENEESSDEEMDESSSREDESIDDDEDDETQANPPLTRSQYAQQRLRTNVANATAENMFSINNMQLI
jgi:hypothetical protein